MIRVQAVTAAVVALGIAAGARAQAPGPQIRPRQASSAEPDKATSYELLDQIRAAIRADDWAEAYRQISRLSQLIYFARQEKQQQTPALELAHAELMAGTNPITRAQYLPRMIKAAFDSGQYGKAEKYAREALAASQTGSFPWTGDAVHQGNIALGRLALLNGDKAAAETYLLAAGNAPKSVQIASLGPNMALARDLFDAGRPDAVIRYLEECRQFWAPGQRKLLEWIALTRAGLRPDFGPNVDY